MQRARTSQATIQVFKKHAEQLPGHGTGVEDEAVNDAFYGDENSIVRSVFVVLANVLGGALLLSGTLVLPHVIAEILR